MEKIVNFVWHESTGYWFVLDKYEKEMFRFPNCGNINILFEGLNKEISNKYDMSSIKKME